MISVIVITILDLFTVENKNLQQASASVFIRTFAFSKENLHILR